LIVCFIKLLLLQSRSSQDSRDNDIKAEIMRNVAAIHMPSYEELKEATKNWHASNLLGQGGFAEVFKGNLYSSAFSFTKK
jgi:hypothetical protein